MTALTAPIYPGDDVEYDFTFSHSTLAVQSVAVVEAKFQKAGTTVSATAATTTPSAAVVRATARPDAAGEWVLAVKATVTFQGGGTAQKTAAQVFSVSEYPIKSA